MKTSFRICKIVAHKVFNIMFNFSCGSTNCKDTNNIVLYDMVSRIPIHQLTTQLDAFDGQVLLSLTPPLLGVYKTKTYKTKTLSP